VTDAYRGLSQTEMKDTELILKSLIVRIYPVMEFEVLTAVNTKTKQFVPFQKTAVTVT
jgi:hypothetical protein